MADKDTKYMQLYEENINLQEALIRETKNAGSSQGGKAPGIKIPMFAGNQPSAASKKAEEKSA